MYYVYLLQSFEWKSLYTGYTNNLKVRLKRHNNKQVVSTKSKAPWTLIYFEAFMNRKDAKTREIYLKSGWGRRSLTKILSNTFEKQQ